MFRFLWKGASLEKYGSKIAWKRVALSLAEGGLGLKSVEEWNKAQIIYHLWQVVSFISTSFWAEWVRKTMLLKHNFWTTSVPYDASCIWRKVLNLWQLVAHFIEYKVGNGLGIKLWQDPWLENQPLARHPLDPIVSFFGILFNATVSEIISNCTWSPPPSNYASILLMKQKLLLIPPPSIIPDQVLWAGHSQVKASTIWAAIRSTGSTVS